MAKAKRVEESYDKKYHALSAKVNGLPWNDPRARAYASAADNAMLSEREGTKKWSEEWYYLFMSSYSSALEDGA